MCHEFVDEFNVNNSSNGLISISVPELFLISKKMYLSFMYLYDAFDHDIDSLLSSCCKFARLLVDVVSFHHTKEMYIQNITPSTGITLISFIMLCIAFTIHCLDCGIHCFSFRLSMCISVIIVNHKIALMVLICSVIYHTRYIINSSNINFRSISSDGLSMVTRNCIHCEIHINNKGNAKIVSESATS